MNRKIIFLPMLLMIALTVFIGCEKEVNNEVVFTQQSAASSDQLEELGILKEWKLEIRSTNGISDLAIPCCDYIVFHSDHVIDDLKGNFSARGVGYKTEGTFTIDSVAKTIQFKYDNIQKTYEFQLEKDLMTLTYDENNQEIIESWRNSIQ